MATRGDRHLSTEDSHDAQGMAYLDTARSRWVTLYLPLAIFVFVLLFPFYWMVITSEIGRAHV